VSTPFRIVIKPTNLPEAWKGKLAGLQQRLYTAIETAMNMTASMLDATAKADIQSAGHFGSRWTEGLHVSVEGAAPNMRISMTHDIPFASVFETGATISGSPLLWIPLSGTDAQGIRARDYSGLFSARQGRYGGPPLLFAKSDKKPRYFGIGQVTIPKKWHLHDDARGAADNFRDAFYQAWKQS
jgi:hypothetical protein